MHAANAEVYGRRSSPRKKTGRRSAPFLGGRTRSGRYFLPAGAPDGICGAATVLPFAFISE